MPPLPLQYLFITSGKGVIFLIQFLWKKVVWPEDLERVRLATFTLSLIILFLGLALFWVSDQAAKYRYRSFELNTATHAFSSKTDLLTDSIRQGIVYIDLIQQWAMYFIMLRDLRVPDVTEYESIDTPVEYDSLLRTSPNILAIRNKDVEVFAQQASNLEHSQTILFTLIFGLQLVNTLYMLRLQRAV